MGHPTPSLAGFLGRHQEEIVRDWTGRMRSLLPARELSDAAIIDHLPSLLSSIASRIGAEVTVAAAGRAPAEDHAVDRLRRGFDLDQIVTEYGLLRRSILDLWEARVGASIDLRELRDLDRAFDDTLRQAIRRQASMRERLLKALDRVSAAALRSTDLDAVVRQLLEATIESSRSIDTAAILLRDGDTLRVRAAAGLEAGLEQVFSIARGEGAAGRAAAGREPVIVRDAANDPDVATPTFRARRVRALYAVPLVHDEDVIGVAHIGSVSAFELSEEDKLLFRTMAARATTVIVQARLMTILRQSDELLRLAVEAAPTALVIVDAGGRITRVNSHAEQMLGYDRGELVGRPVDDLVPARVRAQHRHHRSTFFSDMSRRPMGAGRDLFALRKDGVEVPVEIGLSPFQSREGVFVLAAINDITERKRAEERFRSIAESGVVAIAFFDTSGAITGANDEFLKMVGYTRAELLAGEVRWDRLTPPEWMARTGEAVAEYGRTGRIEPYEKEYFRRDGQRFWGLFAGRRIESTGHGVAVVLDITERKRAEQALREADRRKDEFLAILAHELRNPLAPIRTAVGILRSAGVPEPVRERSRDVIERQVAHMTRLIDDLLDVSRLSRGQMSLQRGPVLLDQVIDAAIETARPAIEQHRHRLERHRAGSFVFLDADLARLSQVFANLLNNAAKYTPAGGTVAIEVTERPGAVDVRVTDTGDGISPDRLDGIFDLFAQGSGGTRSTIGGLGIGLALARRLVELHGGTLTASSPGLGRGSTFIVSLPTISATSPTSRDGDRRKAAARPLGRRVLVVDDSVDAADTLATFLETAGCEARATYDAEQALAVLARFEAEIVLLDVGLPGVDGLEVCRRIRSLPQGRSMFVVAITGWGQDEDRRRTRDAGFDAHLVKPVKPDALLQVVEQAPRPD
jgi:PAS domain S-box-containing protein